MKIKITHVRNRTNKGLISGRGGATIAAIVYNVSQLQNATNVIILTKSLDVLNPQHV